MPLKISKLIHSINKLKGHLSVRWILIQVPCFALYNAHPHFVHIIHGTIMPMCDVHPYFSLKNLGKKLRIIHSRIRYFSDLEFPDNF